MDENTAKPLHYGHMGKAVYNSEDQSWEFSRTILPPPRISYTGVTNISIQSPSTLIRGPSTVKRLAFSQGYPELTAGYKLTRSETLSHAISAASHTCDPQVSSLLDFGRAVDSDIDGSGRRAVSIVAFASGECGNIISFRTIADDLVELEQGTTPQLRVPTIDNQDGIEWSAQGAPIRQICFSNAPEERATFMTVRCSSTLVFRPLYHRNPISVSTHFGNDGIARYHRSSRIDPNFLMEISTLHTGGAAHADVKFNPWDKCQFAIVDEVGNWGIWELRNQPKRNKDKWMAANVRSGTLPWVGVEERQTGIRGRHDGWLTVEWVSADLFVVCDRRCSILYRLEGDRAYSYSMELGFKRKSEWVLGIKRSTRKSSHIFILTTSRLMWFDITPDSIPVLDDKISSLTPRLYWRHFRDSGDTTLQLSALTVDEDFYLVLFSRLNHFASAFYCSEPPEIVNGSASIPDPFILHIPPSDNEEDAKSFSTNSHFSTLVFKEIAQTTAGGEQNVDTRLSLLKAFVIDSSLRVRESLYSKPSTSDFARKRLHGGDVLHVRRLRLAGLQGKAESSLSGFIVDDWDEHAHGNEPISDRGVHNIAPLAEPQFTLDYTQIYALATGALDSLLQDGERTSERSFQESIEELVNKVSDHVSFEAPSSRTALEFLRQALTLDDIDQNAHDLATFVARFAPHRWALGDRHHLLVQPYDWWSSRSAKQVHSLGLTKRSLVAIYDQLVSYWLMDLPADIPGRARIMKEKSIRDLVADIVLSLIVSVHHSTGAESTARSKEDPSTSTSGLMISDELASYEPTTASNYQGPYSQAAIAATQDSSAMRSFVFPESPTHQQSIFSVLSSYTTFSRTGSAPRDAERMLDHWKLGIDPAPYSLVSEELQMAAMRKASRRRSKKRMSQVTKNMSLDSSVLPSVSTPAPAIKSDWGSQPDNSQPPMIILQSSQVTNDIPMTQVERGAFGGREASKKSGIKARKKKRAAGF
ncbi:uncharacterized protein BDV17DRAFT_280929 [Aspergillus undulatus]|uniref:uncharacterized protein n=1 Tax=Aspergillus undulatus TaxID=1810928 RepID=UPI003CCCA6DB